ncbi:MAG: substrate-binding domain-containing protein, partial [Alistipes sp.]|nr:substrate-binding domain-containing protein [Alistipes sp.]
NIPGCNRLAYFGTSSFDAGVVAARLLSDRIAPEADILVGSIIHRGDGGSNQCRCREMGFRDYLGRAGFRGRLLGASLRLDDEGYNRRVLDELFEENPRIAGAVTFNSTCYILANYLRSSGHDGVRLVGYDVIRRNREMLEAGVVTALVAQRPAAQGFHGVMALCDMLVSGRRGPSDNLMPIDIVFRENVRFYNSHII